MQIITSMRVPGFHVKFWRLISFLILFLSILRGIRYPNLWAYSHFLFNYDFGFIKRGLVGAVMSQLNQPYFLSYEFFFVFSLAIFSINIIFLSFLIKDFIDSQNPFLIGCSIVVASSLGIVFLSHCVGYFDQIGLLVTLVTLKISGFTKKMLFLLISMPIAILIHEAIFIMFFPIIFMNLFFSIETGKRIKKILILGTFSIILLVSVVILSNHTLEKSQADEMYSHLQAKIEYPIRPSAFSVLFRDSEVNFRMTMDAWSDRKNFIALVDSLLVTAPSFLIFIYFTSLILKKAKTKFYVITLTICASLSPLLLHLWGWDMDRWNTLAIITSFLMLYSVFTTHPSQPIVIEDPNLLYVILIFLVFMNGVSSIPLFDGYYVKQFPFIEHQKYILDLLHGIEKFPYVPPR